MNNLKKALFAIFICFLLLCQQKVLAATASSIADKTINAGAKTAYYVTKYSLKAGWFIAKKTAKGTVAVTKGVFNGVSDAFSNDKKPKQLKAIKTTKTKPSDSYGIYGETLPPPPPLLD